MTYLNNINFSHGIVFISIRTFVIYVFSIFLFRIGNKRFRLQTPFDFILPIIMGSVLSRGINGSATLASTIISCSLLMILHWFFAVLAFKFHQFGKLVKGNTYILIKDGVVNFKNLKKNQISMNDLKEECRISLHMENLSNIAEARLERNGSISFRKS